MNSSQANTAQMNTAAIPAGYMQNARGLLQATELVSDLDKLRDQTVLKLVEEAKAMSTSLASFRDDAFETINAFVDISAERYGVKVGGNRGGVQLQSFDGRYRVQLAVADKVEFSELLMVAKALVDECLREWSESAGPEIRTLVGEAFQVDKKGKISTGKVLSLRGLDIKHEKWLRAMQAITESITVIGTKPYLRVYERDSKGEYIQLSLDVAKD